MLDLSEATGINRGTLSRMVNQRGYSTVTNNVDLLCKYFSCQVSDLMEYVDKSGAQVVVCVHGDEAGTSGLAEMLNGNGIKAYAPKVGDSVKLGE